MKIMQINRLWRARSEIDRYLFRLSELLENHGHEIVPFAVQDRGNEPSQYSPLFPSSLTTLEPFRLPLWRMAVSTARIFYSREARNRVTILADLTHPDVAHLHKVYLHLSPSVLRPLVERGIGTVMTVHDNKLFCPSHRAYRGGRACYDCKPYRYGRCVSGTCVGGSRIASTLCAAELLAHDIIHAYTGKIDCFIAPSEYIHERLRDRGIPGERIAVIPGFIDSRAWSADDSGSGDYVLFSGSLLPREGIETMIKAFAGLPKIPLKIVGTGMQDFFARELAWELGATNISFLGYRKDEDLKAIIAGCRFVCLPYESPENPPEFLFRALSSGKPAVVSRLGGLPEMISDGGTGLLFEPGDIEGLREAVSGLWQDHDRISLLGREGRRLIERDYTPELHYERMLEVYRNVKRT